MIPKSALQHERRHLVGLILLAWVAVSYILPNRFSFYSPYEVPLTKVDRWIPFDPSWTWIYLSYYAFIIFAYFFAKTVVDRRRYIEAMALSAFVSCFIFIFFPTHIGRDPYPLDVHHSLTFWALDRIRFFDKAVNCLPSMHVCMSSIAAIAYGSQGLKAAWSSGLWTVLIIYSTMATKQHYFLDVVMGLVLAAGSVLFCDLSAARFSKKSFNSLQS
jgi:membrane-associated phospholipid phosphatase